MFKYLTYSIEPYIINECLYVHIPKTGGISINASLFGNLGSGHAPIWRFYDFITEDRFSKYFKFTIVRNPWDRLLSAFMFLKNGGINASDRTWSNVHLKKFTNFETFVREWVNDKNIYSYIHFVPQNYFLCIDNSRPLVDFIGYYENIEEDFQYIAQKIGIKTTLKKLNTNTVKGNYVDYYSDETSAIVEKVYKKDIKMFGYKFDNSSLKSQLMLRKNLRAQNENASREAMED